MTVKDLLMEYDVILASASPRRKELMQLICPTYRVIPADCDECVPNNISCDEVPEYLSCKKCGCISEVFKASVVIGCDTVVMTQDGVILGKPLDDRDARRMLTLLSGKMHKVSTGVSICFGDKKKSFTETTKVWFRELSDEDIEGYIATGETADKAGAYGIQGEGSLLVEKIEGDFYNVVGLPVSRLAVELKEMLE